MITSINIDMLLYCLMNQSSPIRRAVEEEKQRQNKSVMENALHHIWKKDNAIFGKRGKKEKEKRDQILKWTIAIRFPPLGAPFLTHNRQACWDHNIPRKSNE